MSYYCWWGRLVKFWLAFYHPHDIPNIHIKFDNNRSGNFGDYLSFQNAGRRQTDRQTNENLRPIFSYSRGHETLRKYESCQSPDALNYNTFSACVRELKTSHVENFITPFMQLINKDFLEEGRNWKRIVLSKLHC